MSLFLSYLRLSDLKSFLCVVISLLYYMSVVSGLIRLSIFGKSKNGFETKNVIPLYNVVNLQSKACYVLLGARDCSGLSRKEIL